MKSILSFISAMTIIFSLLVNDKPEAKRLIESAQNKLQLKNIHLNMELETFNSKGERKSKNLLVSFAEFDKEKKVLIEFLAPEKVLGTKILTTKPKDKKGIIEIYMPSTGKIQKIRANQRNLKIMGSEIPIAQFGKIVEGVLTYTLLEKETINGIECQKVKVEEQGSKEHRVVFISTLKEYLLRVEKYSAQNKLVNFTELSDYMEIDNSDSKVYPKKIHVKNLKSGKSSNMKLINVNILSKVEIKDFTLSPGTS
jgi:hypothetical protein